MAILTKAWLNSGVDINAAASERKAQKSINEKLWDIEDEIRRREATKSFDAEFVEVARSVYKFNDERSSVKRAINVRFGSNLVEEKSYQPY